MEIKTQFESFIRFGVCQVILISLLRVWGREWRERIGGSKGGGNTSPWLSQGRT